MGVKPDSQIYFKLKVRFDPQIRLWSWLNFIFLPHIQTQVKSKSRTQSTQPTLKISLKFFIRAVKPDHNWQHTMGVFFIQPLQQLCATELHPINGGLCIRCHQKISVWTLESTCNLLRLAWDSAWSGLETLILPAILIFLIFPKFPILAFSKFLSGCSVSYV